MTGVLYPLTEVRTSVTVIGIFSALELEPMLVHGLMTQEVVVVKVNDWVTMLYVAEPAALF